MIREETRLRKVDTRRLTLAVATVVTMASGVSGGLVLWARVVKPIAELL